MSYDANGTVQDAVQFGDGEASIQTISATSDDNVVIAGTFTNSIDLGGGSLMADGSGAFVAKLSSAGEHVWSTVLDGDFSPVGARPSGQGVVVGGGAIGVVSAGDVSLLGSSTRDAAVVSLDPSGTPIWGRVYGLAGAVHLAGIGVTTSNTVLVGAIDASADFGGGALTPQGAEDIFAAVIGP